MDRPTATRLIQETFQNPFDRGRFRYFIKNLLNRVDESKAFPPLQGQYIYESFRNHVKQYERIGTYIDPDEKKIDVIIVYLQKETTLDRGRTTQRNFIARYLKERGEKDAGIIAFVSPDPDDWRFSFVRMDYKLAETPKGIIRPKEEFTPARRYSFLVGKHENSHTAQSKLFPILSDDNHNPTFAELEDAFSTERVTKEFFEKYRGLFLSLKERLDEVITADSSLDDEFRSKGVNTIDFAKKLLGQIVFLYFLQKKGWFGVGRDAVWGTGPKNFLRLLFEKAVVGYSNFFNDILEPLFYEALATERTGDFYSRFNCKIPFLNGGLFDPINNYDWVHIDINLPDDIFSNKENTADGDIGTGILDVFDRYNFTVKEDEPLEKEVAVDPEMLGKVFENLLEVKDRKSKGTYYTPREIVHYMCRETLVHHLHNELEGAVPYADIRMLIHAGEFFVEHDARVEHKGRETDTYAYMMPESVRNHARSIDEALSSVRVCDPAVGSGAFLVGMMSEIVRARNALSVSLESKHSRTPYDFKRHAIHNCLYGADIDGSAVEIAKLRLWLSLVVDEGDVGQIKSLPNLDYKIMQGNSLLEQFAGVKLFDESFIRPALDNAEHVRALKDRQMELQREYIQLHSTGKLTNTKKTMLDIELKKAKNMLEQSGNVSGADAVGDGLFDSQFEARKKAVELRRLHEEYFEATSKNKKDELKARIQRLEWELIEATLKEQKDKGNALKELEQFRRANIRPFFLWKLNFSEVFLEKEGFDVVLANPPYVRQEMIKPMKPGLAAEFDKFYCGTADIYTYFYKRGVDLLKSGGHLCFIAPNKFMRAGYGKNTRELLAGTVTPRIVIDFCDLPIFDATTYPAILLVEKRPPSEEEKTLAATFSDPAELERIDDTLAVKGFPMPVSALKTEGWTLEQPGVLALMEKLRKAGTPLGEYVKGRFYRGILTGLNEAFVIDGVTREKLIAEDPKSADLIKPWLRGRDIKKWKAEWAGLYLIYVPWHFKIQEYPAILNHLSQFRSHLENRNAAERDRYEWYALQRYGSNYHEEFERPKIMYAEIATEGKFLLDQGNHYSDTTTYIMASDSEYLLAVLNSKLFTYMFSQTSSEIRGGFLRWKRQYMDSIPIVEATPAQQAPIASLIQQILANPDSPDVPRLETEIDRLVYALYGLTPNEIRTIEAERSGQ